MTELIDEEYEEKYPVCVCANVHILYHDGPCLQREKLGEANIEVISVRRYSCRASAASTVRRACAVH